MAFIKHNSLKSDIFLILYLFHVFQDPGYLGSRFFRVQVFQGLGFSEAGCRVRALWVHGLTTLIWFQALKEK